MVGKPLRDKILNSLRQFGSEAEYKVYGRDLPSKPEKVGGQIVVPQDDVADISEYMKVFKDDGFTGENVNFIRVGDIFNKDFDDLDKMVTDNMGTPGDLIKNLKSKNKELFEFQRRKTMTLEEQAMQAKELGFDTISQKILLRKPGDMLRPEETLGGFLVLKQLIMEIHHGARETLNIPQFIGDKQRLENLAKLERLTMMAKTMQASLSGQVSEYARGLNIAANLDTILDTNFGGLNRAFESMTNKTVSSMLDQNARNEINYHLIQLSTLDFRKKNEYIFNLPTGVNRTMDVMMEAYINALLSSPVTHTVNVAGNAAFSMMRFMETGIAGVIGNTRQAIAKGMGMDVDPQDMAMVMDAKARMHGFVMAQGDAFKLMGRTFITGDSGDLIDKIDLKRIGIGKTNNIINVIEMAQRGEKMDAAINAFGIATRMPGRFLAVEDEYFKVVKRKQVIYQEAYRAHAIEYQMRRQAGDSRLKAKKEAQKVYKQFLVEPPADVVEKAKKIALQETFQAPINQPGLQTFNPVFNNHLAKILAVPFYRTPTNIMIETLDRVVPLSPILAGLRKSGREFDEALAKITLGWGTMAVVSALVSGEYGDDIIITGTGPSDPKAKAIINKGANVPSTSIGFKKEDGTYDFYSFSRFDPLSFLLTATADYIKTAEYNPQGGMLENMGQALLVAFSEYSQSLPFLQGVAEFNEMLFNKYEKPEKFIERFQKFVATRITDVGLTATSQLIEGVPAATVRKYTSLNIGSPGATSFTATMERLGDPYKSSTRVRKDQVNAMRLEEVSPAILAFYETLNKARARHPLFSKDMPDDVNFWNEPIMQMDPDQIQETGKFAMYFNPIRIQSGSYKPLDEELIRLSETGMGTFSLHSTTQRGYKLYDGEYRDFVFMVNNLDDDGNLPTDRGYDSTTTMVVKMNRYLDPRTLEGQEYFKADEEEKFNLLNDVLSDARKVARDKLFSSGRLKEIYEADNPEKVSIFD